MRVVLGGTFSPLHKGHKALFSRAFELGKGEEIIVGLTSDAMAQANRTRQITPYKVRKTKLEEYLKIFEEKYPGTKIEIIEINEVFNIPITQEIEVDALVVSEGRKQVAEETNKHRRQHGMRELQIVVVPYVLAEDGLPIKATRITNGEIDADGKILGTVKVAVGTENEVKLRAVKNIFSKLYKNLEVLKVPVHTGVRAQPWDDETIAGAKTRAVEAIKQIKEAYFGVGIEAGLFLNKETNKYFDVQFCAIQDRGGRVTIGHGAGFYYPDKLLAGVQGGKTVGEVMSEVTGIQDIGKKKGAIGYLSNQLLTREQLTEQAVLMAMVPRLTELYE